MNNIVDRNYARERAFQQQEKDYVPMTADWEKVNSYKIPNQSWMGKVQYYTSVVKGSHEFPNQILIRPFETETVPSTSWSAINESIQKNKQVFVGGKYIPVVPSHVTSYN
jgi:hypothetical protein